MGQKGSFLVTMVIAHPASNVRVIWISGGSSLAKLQTRGIDAAVVIRGVEFAEESRVIAVA